MRGSEKIAEEAVKLAAQWQNRANTLQTRQEKTRHAKLARLFTNPKDKVILTQLIDQSFRSTNCRRVADQIHYLLSRWGIPTFFSPLEKFLMLLFMHAGRFLPRLTVPRVIEKMRQDSSHLIISGETKALDAFLQKRIGPWRTTAGGRKPFGINGRKVLKTAPWKFRWWWPARKYLKLYLSRRERI